MRRKGRTVALRDVLRVCVGGGKGEGIGEGREALGFVERLSRTLGWPHSCPERGKVSTRRGGKIRGGGGERFKRARNRAEMFGDDFGDKGRRCSLRAETNLKAPRTMKRAVFCPRIEGGSEIP